MPRIEVDLSQNKPPVSIPADAVDNLKRMPLAPGSRYETPKQNTRVGSSVVVRNAPQDDGGCPAPMPVEAASRYLEPPKRVGAPTNPMAAPLE